jgi:hypothetical protein
MEMDKIREMIERYPEAQKLPCPVAHFIASLLQVSPRQVGEAADDLKRKITFCQLGLFGYGRKGISEYKILGRKVALPAHVMERIAAAASDKKTISCKDLWDIAEAEGAFRVEIGTCADVLKLKITDCQLGAF